ncbi:HdeD family acid-resistance protein [Luteimicrobium sp. DT211]|uniref:HdeD family acid-resistance protein n=1 Tax=Luteimicrobium sp. DT211 TaxID=3393412 RepID=UPI003CF4591D
MTDVPTAPDPYARAVQGAARQYWWLPVLRGVLTIVFGLVAVIWPGVTALAILWVIAIFAIVDGLLEIFDAIRYRAAGGTALGITFGVLSVAFGIVALVWPGPTVTVFAVIVGIWAILVGLVGLAASIDLRKVVGSGWAWGAITAGLTVVLGILLLIWPKGSLAALVWLVGIWAFVAGIVLVVIGFQVRRLGKADLTV